MVKGKMKYCWVGVATAIFVIAAVCIGAQEAGAPSGEKARADIITIDTLKVFGYLEKPAVVFLHDQHTEALKKKEKDCSACHLSQERSNKIPGTFKAAVNGIDPLSPKFKRLEDTARKEVMDVYHTFCISCHTDMAAEGDKSGPVTCGECHKETDLESNRVPIGLDQNLHYRHLAAQEKKCETCHHEYDPEKKVLFYAKGKEGTCRYCHKEQTEENRISMREASHLDCISCHRKRLAKKATAGPIYCGGCHDPASQKKFQKLENVPRLERNQPDMVLIKVGEVKPEAPDKPGDVRMNAVSYDHKAHEGYSETCRVCHHASMETCSKCHTLSGSKDGEYVNLAQAYHLINSEKSCMGCHEMEKNDPKCSGCHVFIEKRRKQAEEACLKCHEEMAPELQRMAKEDEKRVAEMMIRARTYTTETYDKDDIPEKVVIDVLAKPDDKYEAVELPHRKIVDKLTANIRDSKLATYYHQDRGTMCQGCHHNSPVSKKPPKCATCHGKPFDERQLLRPGLLGAYHQQCMTCHEQMKLEKPAGCTGCHKEKKK
jgi:hypothetical protein